MNFQSLYEQRQKFFLTPGSMARGGLIFCILVGVVTLLAGFASGQATRTWGSYIFNFMFFFPPGRQLPQEENWRKTREVD